MGADARLRDFAVASLPAGWTQALTNIERGDNVQAQLSELHDRAPNEATTKEIAAMSAPTEPTSGPTTAPAAPMTSAPTEPPMAAPTAAPAEMSRPKIALKDLGPAPEIVGDPLWFNSEP